MYYLAPVSLGRLRDLKFPEPSSAPAPAQDVKITIEISFVFIL